MSGDSMSVLPGFEDLKARDVIAFNGDGTVSVILGDKIQRLQVQVGPAGALMTRIIDRNQPPDQAAPARRRSREERYALTDQGSV